MLLIHLKGADASHAGMIGYTLAEIGRLLVKIGQYRPPDPGHASSWSHWRRNVPKHNSDKNQRDSTDRGHLRVEADGQVPPDVMYSAYSC